MRSLGYLLALTLFCASALSATRYEQLESVKRSDPAFLDSLVELQKIHYRTHQWQKFFAYARYYRQNYLTNPEDAKKSLKPRLLSLEMMALMKHCQWDPAMDIGQFSKKVTQKYRPEKLEEINKALSFVKLASQIQKEIKTAPEAKPGQVFADKIYWPVKNSTLASIKHPKKLRVIVGSKCK